MSGPTIVWAGLVVLYGAFFAWYTSFGGPLTAAEIERVLVDARSNGRPAEEIAGLRDFLESDTGDDFAVVNIIETNDPVPPTEGLDADATAEDALAEYMAYMWPALLRRACHPVLFGAAAAQSLDVWGIEGAALWTTAGVMRYRSRRDLIEIATHPEFGGRHAFKIAAMHKTIAFPIDPWFHLGDPRILLALAALVLGLVAHGIAGHRRSRRRGGLAL